jgi:hypothetical protein
MYSKLKCIPAEALFPRELHAAGDPWSAPAFRDEDAAIATELRREECNPKALR